MSISRKMQPIGIYDSGIGGLTVLKTLQEKFPHENFVYFGDTLNLPYGAKSQDQIITYSRNIMTWLQQEAHVKLVVAACHTSSALALEEISQGFEIPIVGTIYPLMKNVLKKENIRKIGIIATPASIKSLMHEKILRKSGFQGEILSIACPEFVPLIEAEKWNKNVLKEHVEYYLKMFIDQKFDTLIYGCTHYPFIKSLIEEILPLWVTQIDPAEYMALEVFEILSKRKLLNDETLKGKISFFCSSEPDIFTKKIQKLMEFERSHIVLKDVHSFEKNV